ncbi:periplasmic heavy metal sensor [Pseudogemmobacter blasticus]|uniref:Periplasmic heavy metal sensor n=1 Tax=Fuscovulum blasticum DSM 2131 TaxID=1188250 RepID=A0A2T4J6K9_FUSBL|nr:periplasmic heavy metal sensor [Fuscovulum blasticum]PTE13534.1 hypothetical protein C5F44_13345 [Fuscovulum blasticum DSM 2131]
MTEPVAPPAETPPPAPAPVRTAGWVKLLLGVSLALNLAVAGLAAGAFLRDGGPPQRRDRDLGFGPLGEALSHQDRKALRAEFLRSAPELVRGRAEMQADFTALVTVLRAPVLDPAALDSALATIANRNAEMLAKGREVIAGHLKAMSPEARAEFADRLEKALKRASRQDRDSDKGKDKPGKEKARDKERKAEPPAPAPDNTGN